MSKDAARPSLPRPDAAEVSTALRSVALWDVRAREIHALRRECDRRAALVDEAREEVEALLAIRAASRAGYPPSCEMTELADLIARMRAATEAQP